MSVINIEPEDFENEVANYKGIVIVNFYTTWSRDCYTVKPLFEEASEQVKEEFLAYAECDKSAEYINYVKSVKFIKMDIDYPVLAEKLGITTIPTVIVFKDGKEFSREVGLFDVSIISFALHMTLITP